MTEPATETRAADDDMSRASGWDALLDDLFGLNVRALASMWAILATPRRVFDAARDVDWLGKYTPSIRLVFTLIAAIVFLRFLWGNDGGALFELTRAGFAEIPDLADQFDLDQLARDYLTLWLAIYPFTYFAFHAVTAALLRVWGKGTPAPVRLRLYFAALLPGLLLGVMSTGATNFMDAATLDAVSMPALGLTAAVYALTVFRGLPARMPAAARAWRSVLFGGMAISVDLLIAIVAFTMSLAWIYGTGAP